MFKDAQEEELLEIRLQASLHDKEFKVDQQHKQQQSESAQVSSQPLFRDPRDYEKMTPEEKKKETERMMKFFKNTKARSPKTMGL